MRTLCILLAILSAGNLHASLFDLSLIKDEDECFNGTPNIATTSSFSRPIGALPGSYAALGISPTEMPVLAPSSSITDPPSSTAVPPLNSSKLPSFDSKAGSTESAGLSEGNSDKPRAKRARSEAHVLDDLEEYIRSEIIYFAFKKAEKKDVLRNVIKFIANNDYDGFVAYESVFEASFKHGYHLFKRGPAKADYMMHYIIRFGATNFLESYSYSVRVASKDSNIESAFENLIATKPLDTLILFLKKGRYIKDQLFLKKGRYIKDQDVIKAISNAVQKHHPTLHFLDYFVFESESFGTTSLGFDYALKIFEAKTENEKFDRFTEFLDFERKFITGPNFRYARFLEIPLRYETYFLSFDIELQYDFAKMAILNDDLGKLTRILELVPDLATYNSRGNLFSYAARFTKTNILQFFVEIVPEIIGLEADDRISPIGISIDREKMENLRVFEAAGYDFNQGFQYQGTFLTAIQSAFKLKRAKAFSYILEKIGAENALQQLMQVYGSTNEIMSHAMRPTGNLELVLILRDSLGFDLNDNYVFGEKTGNIMIFLDVQSYTYNLFKTNLGLE